MSIGEVCRAVSKAHQEVIRAASSYPMLMNISEDLQEGELRQVLGYLVIMHSIKEENEPSDEQINIMLALLRSQFRTVTMAELKLAADINIAKPLPANDSEKGPNFRAKPFQCIDVEFISTILHNYQHEKMEAFKAFRQAAPSTRIKGELQAPPASLQSLMKWYQEKKELPMTYNWLLVFDDMRKEGKCEPFEVMQKWMEPEKQKIIAEQNGRKVFGISDVEKREIELRLSDDGIKTELRVRYVKKRIPELCQIAI